MTKVSFLKNNLMSLTSMQQIRKNIQIDAENLETIEFSNSAGYNVLQIKKGDRPVCLNCCG